MKIAPFKITRDAPPERLAPRTVVEVKEAEKRRPPIQTISSAVRSAAHRSPLFPGEALGWPWRMIGGDLDGARVRFEDDGTEARICGARWESLPVEIKGNVGFEIQGEDGTGWIAVPVRSAQTVFLSRLEGFREGETIRLSAAS